MRSNTTSSLRPAPKGPGALYLEPHTSNETSVCLSVCLFVKRFCEFPARTEAPVTHRSTYGKFERSIFQVFEKNCNISIICLGRAWMGIPPFWATF